MEKSAFRLYRNTITGLKDDQRKGFANGLASRDNLRNGHTHGYIIHISTRTANFFFRLKGVLILRLRGAR